MSLTTNIDTDLKPFQRGKPTRSLSSSVSTPSVTSAVRYDKDILFGNKQSTNSNDKSSQAKKRKALSELKPKSTKNKSSSSTNKRPKSVPPPNIIKSAVQPNYTNIQVGQIILATITQINEIDAYITAPGGLRGILVMRELSDIISSTVDQYIETSQPDGTNHTIKLPLMNTLVAVNQLIPCVVINKNPQSKRIEVSCRASLLNKYINYNDINAVSLQPSCIVYGEIQSLQDNGYIVTFGDNKKSKTTGFLPYKQSMNAPDSQPDNIKKYQLGTPVMCTVVSQSARNILQLSNTIESLTRTHLNTDLTVSINDINVGQLVKCTVQFVFDDANGCVVAFNDGLHGTITAVHMIRDRHHNNKSINVGDELVARVLFVDLTNKSIVLTAHHSIVKQYKCNELTGYHIGQIIDSECTITAVHSKRGLTLTLDDASTSVQLQCKPTQCSDDTIDSLSEKYRINQIIHKCRIVAINSFDSVIYVTLKQSVIDQTIMSINDILIASIIDCTIHSFESYGILVNITKSIRGLIPSLHNADIPLTEPQRKYKLNQPIKCRVLNVSVNEKKIILTAKSSLINDTKYHALTRYNMALIGHIHTGFITKIADFGMIVEYYDHVHALIPINDLIKHNIVSTAQQLNTQYYVGQVVKTRITSVDSTNNKLVVSLQLREITDDNLPHIGSTVTGTICQVDEDVIKIQLKKYKKLVVLLPVNQLCDIPSMVTPQLIQQYFTVGRKLKQLFVTNIDHKNNVYVSYKALYNADTLQSYQITSYDQLQLGSLIYGTIRNITAFGLFIDCCHSISVLCPTVHIADNTSRKIDINELYQLGQTVRCKILSVVNGNTGKQRVTVSTKPSDIDDISMSVNELKSIYNQVIDYHLIGMQYIV